MSNNRLGIKGLGDPVPGRPGFVERSLESRRGLVLQNDVPDSVRCDQGQDSGRAYKAWMIPGM